MQSQPSHKNHGILVDPIERRNRRAEESSTAYAFRVLIDDPGLREVFSDFMVRKTGIDGEGEENWRQGRWNS